VGGAADRFWRKEEARKIRVSPNVKLLHSHFEVDEMDFYSLSCFGAYRQEKFARLARFSGFSGRHFRRNKIDARSTMNNAMSVDLIFYPPG